MDLVKKKNMKMNKFFFLMKVKRTDEIKKKKRTQSALAIYCTEKKSARIFKPTKDWGEKKNTKYKIVS